MAKLVLDYYKGKDLYSDGDIEKHILEAVQNRWDLLDLTEYVKPKEYYVFLYHLSLIRENILNWYPFKKGCRILEVGSGCHHGDAVQESGCGDFRGAVQTAGRD